MNSPTPLPRNLTLLTLLYNSLASLVAGLGSSVSHSIPYGTEECMVIRVPPEPHVVSGSFSLLDTKYSPDPVRIALYNNKEELIWDSNPKAISGTFSKQSAAGKHWLCLENGLTYEQDGKTVPPNERVTRTIGFSLRIKPPAKANNPTKVQGGVAIDIDDTTGRLIDMTEHLNEKFERLLDHMSFMKSREIVHRELHEETFTKVVRWNILEICTVVVVSVCQVFNVWYLLNNRRSSLY
ncbi:hypothetical protein ACHAWO_000042 [Cyclotella atomus]|uniref:GOLD domain-containing protein n=1 Tax=Cyclotella atomus TaxID=382360 RepID=A0ABD3P986_9STRA